MKFFETSKYFSLKKSTYINLRWIAIIGQVITVNIIYFVFDFRFNLVLENLINFDWSAKQSLFNLY
jgi:two-component system sensor histidine kinase RegB